MLVIILYFHIYFLIKIKIVKFCPDYAGGISEIHYGLFRVLKLLVYFNLMNAAWLVRLQHFILTLWTWWGVVVAVFDLEKVGTQVNLPSAYFLQILVWLLLLSRELEELKSLQTAINCQHQFNFRHTNLSLQILIPAVKPFLCHFSPHSEL